MSSVFIFIYYSLFFDKMFNLSGPNNSDRHPEEEKKQQDQDVISLKKSRSSSTQILKSNQLPKFFNLDEDVGVVLVKKNTNIKITKINRNPYAKISDPTYLLSQSHVYDFYSIGINMNALNNPGKEEESSIKTVFYCYSIERVETRKTAIILYLKANETKNQPPIQYFIDRFKSYGDQTYYEIANKMADLHFFMEQMKEMGKQTKVKEDPPSQIIDFMANRLYLCKFSQTKLIFSKSFLKLLGYDDELFAIQAAKYKFLPEEFLSSENYRQITLQCLDIAKWMRCLVENKITASVFGELTAFEFTDHLLGKDNKILFCKLKIFFPTPNAYCMQVLQVISQTEKYQESNSSSSHFNKRIRKIQSENIQLNQYRTLQRLVKMPKNMQSTSENKVAGYKVIDKKQQN